MTTSANQSFLDLAIQEHGSVLCAFDFAVANGLSLTTQISPGTNLNVPESIFRNNDIALFYKNNFRKVATASIPNFEFSEYEFPQGEFPITL